MRIFLSWLFLLFTAIWGVWYTANYALAFSGFAWGYGSVALGVTIVLYIDVYILKDIDTIAEIKKGNYAVGLLYVAIAILIAGALAGAQ